MAGGDNSEEAIEVLILGYLGALFLVLLMTPQMWHNYNRGSVEGLSLMMCVMWKIASVLVSGYLLQTDAATPLLVTWGLNAWSFVVVEAQFVQYGGCLQSEQGENKGPVSNDIEAPIREAEMNGNQELSAMGIFTFWVAFLGLTVPTGMGILLSWWVCEISPEWLAITVGGVLPSVLLGVGFVPQVCQLASTSFYLILTLASY